MTRDRDGSDTTAAAAPRGARLVLWPSRLMQRLGWAALRMPDYRVYLTGQAVANIGAWLYFAALGWYILSVTDSPGAVAAIYAAAMLPGLAVTLYGGAASDRFGPRPVLAASLVGTAALTALLALVVHLGYGSPPVVAAIAVGIGMCGALGGPAGFTIVGDLVRPNQVSSGFALIFLQLNVARIVGGVAAGLALTLASPSLGFAIAAVLAIAGLLSVLRLETAGPDRAGRRSRSGPAQVLLDLRGALRFARRDRLRLVLIGLGPVPGAIGLGYLLILPALSQEFGLQTGGLGAILAASGIGGLIASLATERLQRLIGHGRAVVGGLAVAAASLLGVASAPKSGLALILFAPIGAAFVVYPAATLAILHAATPARLRGRLTSLFSLLFWGMLPVGGLIIAPLVQAAGVRVTLAVGAGVVLLAAVIAAAAHPALLRIRLTADGRIDR